jgi:hypothetical protein
MLKVFIIYLGIWFCFKDAAGGKPVARHLKLFPAASPFFLFYFGRCRLLLLLYLSSKNYNRLPGNFQPLCQLFKNASTSSKRHFYILLLKKGVLNADSNVRL